MLLSTLGRSLTSRLRLLLCGAALLALVVDSPAPAAETVNPAGAKSTQLYNVNFEWKLLHRSRAWGRTVAVDQWSGGELQFAATSTPRGETTFHLVEVTKTPWVFRWYPTKKDLKLGFAEHVASPNGHPFGALELEASKEARRLAKLWLRGERVRRNSFAPSWQASADQFWRACRAERKESPVLSEPPVFPFHVLGDIEGRATFTRTPRLGVDDGSITEQMTRPWLRNGWERATQGQDVTGYGSWVQERPKWEPKAIEGLMQALAILDSPWLAKDGSAPAHNATWSWNTPLERVAELAATLNPKAGSRLEWSAGDKAGKVTVTQDSALTRRTLEIPVFEVDDLGQVRLWRTGLFNDQEQLVSDEAQVFAGDGSCGTQVWLRIGYSLAAEPADS